MRASKAIFSVGDKAIFDALNQHGVTKEALRKLFLARGIVYSHKASRKELAMYFSRLVHGYSDYALLTELLQPVSRRERLSSKLIKGDICSDDYESAANKLKEEIEEKGDTSTIDFLQNGNIVIGVSYTVENFNRSELKQKVVKKAEVVIEKNKEGSTLRYQSNHVVAGWADRLVSYLREVEGLVLEVKEVSLNHINCSKKRTDFFTSLIKSLKDCTFHDVTDVFVYQPKNDLDLKEEDGIGRGDDLDVGIHITKASLKGEGVLSSSEFTSLLDKGFYISKIIWQSSGEPVGTSDLYEFEAQFSDPETCSSFTYLARGFYKRAEDGMGHVASRTALSDSEERRFSQNIESAAWEVIERLEKG